MSEDMTPLRKNTNKKGLGRGLGSLLGEVGVSASGEEASEPAKPQTHQIKPEEKATVAAPVATVPKIVTPANASIVAAQTAPVQKPNVTAAPTSTASPAPLAATVVPDESRIWMVPIEKVVANKDQPRKVFDPERLEELARSIKEKGILLPILTRKISTGEFEIIAGERRWRAAQLSGAKEVPIIIRKSENREVLELALIENIQRQELNPIEEADAYIMLASRYNLTQQQIAEKVGKDRATVANLMRLSALTAEVKSMVRSGELQLGQAKVIMSLESPIDQIKAAKKVIQLRLSVRATEKLVQKIKEKSDEASNDQELDLNLTHIRSVTTELQSLLGTKVQVDMNGQRSKVSIQFYSTPELNQFIDRLRKLKQ